MYTCPCIKPNVEKVADASGVFCVQDYLFKTFSLCQQGFFSSFFSSFQEILSWSKQFWHHFSRALKSLLFVKCCCLARIPFHFALCVHDI